MKCTECDVEMKQQDNKWWCDACVATWDFTPALRLGCAVIPLRQLLEWAENISNYIGVIESPFMAAAKYVPEARAKIANTLKEMREVGGVKHEMS